MGGFVLTAKRKLSVLSVGSVPRTRLCGPMRIPLGRAVGLWVYQPLGCRNLDDNFWGDISKANIHKL